MNNILRTAFFHSSRRLYSSSMFNKSEEYIEAIFSQSSRRSCSSSMFNKMKNILRAAFLHSSRRPYPSSLYNTNNNSWAAHSNIARRQDRVYVFFYIYIWVYVVSLVLPRSSAHGFSKRSRLTHFLLYVMHKYYDEAMCLRLFKLYNMTDILAISQKHTYSRCQQTN